MPEMVPADMVVLALGVRPATSFLAGTSIEMEKGAIVVGPDMGTSVDDVYAAGDCALVTSRITGRRMYSAMGSTANITARILARAVAGKDASYPGAAGTGVVKLPGGLNAGRTGLTEEAAIREIWEELGTDISIDSRLCTITHQYSHGLLSFSCGKTRRNIWPSDDLIRTPS